MIKKNINENFLYKGIAFRAFEKKFQLADNIKIKEATLKNGLLNIDLLKILPKEVKKARIDICRECNRFDESRHVCRECGCFLVNKVKFTASRCPLSYW